VLNGKEISLISTKLLKIMGFMTVLEIVERGIDEYGGVSKIRVL
tara:strand:- start:610 stop:741 length:132 start_codon:yes stop_codon:yes gene_type:complete